MAGCKLHKLQDKEIDTKIAFSIESILTFTQTSWKFNMLRFKNPSTLNKLNSNKNLIF